MQLKREMDYSIRLLAAAGREAVSSETAINAHELGLKTFVPAVVASRLCRKMVDAKMMSTVSGGRGESLYYIHSECMERNLYDLIFAIEGSASLFAVFDRNKFLYAYCKDNLDRTESQIRSCLEEIKIKDLICCQDVGDVLGEEA